MQIGIVTSDWEAAVPTLLASPPVLAPVVHQTPEKVKEKEVPKQKQRGRGAFTYGGGGNLYSDMSQEEGVVNERLNQNSSTGAANDHCRCLKLLLLLHQASPKKIRDPSIVCY